MPDLRLDVCGFESCPVLVLDNLCVCIMCFFGTCAKDYWIPVCDFVFGMRSGVFVRARSHVWRGILNYNISRIYPGFGHSKFRGARLVYLVHSV